MCLQFEMKKHGKTMKLVHSGNAKTSETERRHVFVDEDGNKFVVFVTKDSNDG